MNITALHLPFNFYLFIVHPTGSDIQIASYQPVTFFFQDNYYHERNYWTHWIWIMIYLFFEYLKSHSCSFRYSETNTTSHIHRLIHGWPSDLIESLLSWLSRFILGQRIDMVKKGEWIESYSILHKTRAIKPCII